MRHEAAGSVRVSMALQEAAEELGANSAAREAVARWGQLQQAASRDTSESTALRIAAREVALYLGHDQDVGEVDLLNGVDWCIETCSSRVAGATVLISVRISPITET